jgi:hypothetical protein
VRRAGAILLAAALAAGLVACSRPLARARTETFQPVFPAEQAARERLQQARCSPRWGLLFPGLGQLCTGHPGEGLALLGLGAAELATVVAVARSEPEGIEHPGAAVPAVAFQDLWVYGVVAPALEGQRARQALYAPQDTVGDLLAAPYNLQVLRRPEVWGGILGTLALGVGVSLAVDEGDSDSDGRLRPALGASSRRPALAGLGDDPDLFGTTVDRRVGYPAAFAAGTALFYHVAIAEEVLFRGLVQSTLARRSGPTAGWINGSLIFGAMHAFNAFTLPADQRRDYLLIGVPFITVIGGYLGWVYRHGDYGLAPPVAVHFWYDFLLSAVFFAMDPQSSPLSGSVAVRF